MNTVVDIATMLLSVSVLWLPTIIAIFQTVRKLKNKERLTFKFIALTLVAQIFFIALFYYLLLRSWKFL